MNKIKVKVIRGDEKRPESMQCVECEFVTTDYDDIDWYYWSTMGYRIPKEDCKIIETLKEGELDGIMG